MTSELRQAARMLRKRAGFTAVAVVTLAVGIGVNSAIFSIVNAIALRELPYPEPERLVAVFPDSWFSKEELEFLSEQVSSYENLAAYSGGGAGFALTGGDRPEMLDAMTVTSSFFPTLGIEAALGRTFLRQEMEPGQSDVVVLSHELWQRRFAADPGVLGTRLELDGMPHEVVGILPPGVRFLPIDAALWVPLTFDPGDAEDYQASYLLLVGRLADGISSGEAGRELQAAASRMQERFAVSEAFVAGASVAPLREHMIGDVRPVLWTLLGAVGFILLTACANVANLALAQAVDRRREIAVRIALGASRRQLIRQILTENVLLALLGGGLGLLLAGGAIGLLVPRLPAGTPRVHEIAVDLPVLGFTLLVSVAVGLLFGLAPVLRSRRVDVQASLKEGSAAAVSGRRMSRSHGALVVAEIALALVLSIWAGLLVKSFWRLQNVELGFDAGSLLTQRLSLVGDRYAEPARRDLFYRQVEERLSALPGVASVGAIQFLPLTGSAWRGGVAVEGRPELDENPPVLFWRVVTPGYFEALGVPLIAGRLPEPSDTVGSPPVAVVNQEMARRFWPNEGALGKRIRNQIEGDEWVTVVGVVADHRFEDLASVSEPVMYRPYSQVGRNLAMSLVLRTRSDPAALAPAASREIWSIDPEVPIYSVRTMDRVIYESVAEPRVVMALLAGFSGIALLLGIVGVYGMMSYAVRSRVHEIGVRMALGAHRGAILRSMLRRSGLLALGGVAVGLLVALGTTKLVAGLLFEVHPWDPLTFSLVPLILILGALAGGLIPSLRASRADPLAAIRRE